MRNLEYLKQEFTTDNKIFAPYYYEYLGYKKDISASKNIARANAISALFTLPKPHIYEHDWIAGSIKSLFVEDNGELENAKRICASFGSRTFSHNFDHFSPNYKKLVKSGINGLIKEIESSIIAHSDDNNSVEFLQAMKITVNAFATLITNYACEALEKSKTSSDKRFNFIHNNLMSILKNAPETFAQALQLVWLCHTCFLYEGRFAMSLGRIDQYLLDFYERDVKNGVITREKALELLESVFIKIYETRAFKGLDDVVNICIGGSNSNGKSEVNELSYLVLEAVKNCNIPGPNLSARISKNTPNEFLDECLKVIGTGLGYPALMNDEIKIPALKKYGYDLEDICDYTMVGCVENFITGKQPPWTDGRFDTPKFLECALNNGKAIYSNYYGLDCESVNSINNMSEFMRILEKQLEYGSKEYYACFINENSRLNSAEYTQPFLSCFCDDCIKKSKDICCGGSKYPSVHGVALMGVGTMCDSLSAIEKVVFVDKKASLEDIRNACSNNFVGYDELHNLLLSAPKYGNNDNFVDKYAVWFVDFLSKCFSLFKTRDGGSVYIAMAANINNIFAGKTISATPDGRLAGQPLSDAASPTYGMDTCGATSTINSVVKPDYTKVACGTVVNQKFSPSMFCDDKRAKLLALIKVYFNKGGQEIQINATSREVLQKAMVEPEKYKNLVVRVSGFSALYVTLDKDVQLDILNRTQQG